MKRRRLEPSHLYVATISCLGIGLLMFLAFPSGQAVHRPVGELVLLVTLVIAGELLPIKVTRGSELYELTTSTTFSFALLLSWGLGPALLAQAAGSLCADLLRRKPWWKSIFNVAQYAIALTSGAVVLSAATSLPRPALDAISLGDMPGILAAIAIIHATNSLTMGGGIAFSQGIPLGGVLRGELSPVTIADGLLLLLSPVMVALTDESYLFVLLVLIPLISISAVSRQNSKLVTELRGQAEENQYQALHDSLTDLPNRTLMRDRVDQAVRVAEREGRQCAVMIMDLDRFKEVNDSLGHHNGDVLLKSVASRLEEALRQSDTVARLGGDEFAVLLPRVREAAAATSAANKMLEALEAPFNLEGLTLEIGASVGIAIYPQNGLDADTLFQRADVAMYAAKEKRAGARSTPPSTITTIRPASPWWPSFGVPSTTESWSSTTSRWPIRRTAT